MYGHASLQEQNVQINYRNVTSFPSKADGPRCASAACSVRAPWVPGDKDGTRTTLHRRSSRVLLLLLVSTYSIDSMVTWRDPYVAHADARVLVPTAPSARRLGQDAVQRLGPLLAALALEEPFARILRAEGVAVLPAELARRFQQQIALSTSSA